jgi:hypothetical protein
MRLLEPRQLTFYRDAAERLCVCVAEETTYQAVRCVALFPISEPDRHISLQIPGPQPTAPFEEIGILTELGGLPPAQQRLAREDMLQRYFVPEITDILKIQKKGGVETWQVLTDRGGQSFAITDKHENISMTDKGVVFIVDTARLRYKISHYQSLPARARAMLEKVLL